MIVLAPPRPRHVTRAASVGHKPPEGWVWCPTCSDYRFSAHGGRWVCAACAADASPPLGRNDLVAHLSRKFNEAANEEPSWGPSA